MRLSNDYDSFAAAYSEENDTNLVNAYYERPAILTLAGDVRGRHILDAGCGSGPVSAALQDRGATVTGFDSSAAMVELPGDGSGRPPHSMLPTSTIRSRSPMVCSMMWSPLNSNPLPRRPSAPPLNCRGGAGSTVQTPRFSRPLQNHALRRSGASWRSYFLRRLRDLKRCDTTLTMSRTAYQATSNAITSISG
ncbi:MAG TPA: methyltransferase domain-containing protein [Propionicimonas sp.]